MANDGERSFMRALCAGRIDEDLLLPYHTVDPDQADTLRAVLQSVDDLLGPRAEDFRRWDRAGELPTAFLQELKDFGLFGLVIPERYGGLGFRATAYSRTLQQVARHDASVAVTIGAHSSIGMRGLLLYGTQAQQDRWMPSLATGERIAAFCLTEPEAGSDAASVRTTAERDGDHYVLNGSKLWITNGGIAQFFTVFAKVAGADERRHMSAFVVTADMPGVTVGPHEDKMGLRASATNAVFLQDVRVPADHLLGEPGKGFKAAMGILNSGRTGLGGGCIGGMKRLIELATSHALSRQQFGRPIAEFGLIKDKIGAMTVDCYAAEAAVNVVNGMIDRHGADYAVAAAISKIFATEAMWRIADEALQIAGGTGFMCDYPYERFLRDARINRIFEGTNEVLRLFVALTAMNDVGAQLTELSSGLKGLFDDPIKGFGLMSGYARKRAALATGVGSAAFTKLSPGLAEPAAAFEGAARKLASAVDRVLRKHGKGIIGKQFASKRLANILIDLFVYAATLARVDAAIRSGAPDLAVQRQLLDVFAGRALRRVEENLARIDDNDDETVKAIAAHVFGAGGYRWDTL